MKKKNKKNLKGKKKLSKKKFTPRLERKNIRLNFPLTAKNIWKF